MLSIIHYLAGRTPNSSQRYKRNQRSVWGLQQHRFPLKAPFLLFTSSLFCPPEFIPPKPLKHEVDHNQPKAKCEQRQVIFATAFLIPRTLGLMSSPCLLFLGMLQDTLELQYMPVTEIYSSVSLTLDSLNNVHTSC